MRGEAAAPPSQRPIGPYWGGPGGLAPPVKTKKRFFVFYNLTVLTSLVEFGEVIKGSELVLWMGHSEVTMVVEFPRIIEALVKKQKVEKPCWEI